MNTIEFRKELKLDQQAFADKFDIPVEIVKYWDSEDCMPDYVLKLIKELNIWRTLYKKKFISFV